MGQPPSLIILDKLFETVLNKLTPTSAVSLHYAIKDSLDDEFTDLEELLERWEANIKIANETSMDEVIIRYIFEAYMETIERNSEDITDILDRMISFTERVIKHIEMPA